MHRVIASYLHTFVNEHNFADLSEDKQFEHFCNFCVVSSVNPESFDLSQITTGESDEGIDGCAVIINEVLITSADEVSALFLERKSRQFDVAYIFSQVKRSENFDAGGIQALAAGVERILSTPPIELHDENLDELRRMHEVIVANLSRVRNGRPRCLAYYITTGIWQDSNNLQKYIDQSVNHLNSLGVFDSIKYEPIDRDGLIKLWMQTREPAEATFSVQGTLLPIPSIKGVQEAYLALVTAREFVNKILSEEDGRLRPSIFEQNVRAFLGDENPINQKIASTILTPSSHDRFAVLNNGITVVSPDVKVQSNTVSIRGYQIVNGCQTSHVLHRYRDSLTDGILIPLKIIEASDNDVVAAIVEATNSQSEVTSTQFESIKPCVRKIEAYFDAVASDDDLKLYFERRTRQFAGGPVSKVRIFSIEKMACATAAMFLDQPHDAVKYPNQPLREKTVQLFKLFQDGHREIPYYTAAAALYRLELSLGNDYVPRDLQRFKWHMLMIVRHRLVGPDRIPLSANKIDKICEALIGVIRKGGRAAAQPFLDAAEIIRKAGLVSRDKLKSPRYTELIKLELSNYPAPSSSSKRPKKVSGRH